MVVRPSEERGYFKNEWLESFHSFSFADYFDSQHMHFHDLRVINQDFVQPGQGFATHPHRDMEILTYVYSGAITHQDSMGHFETIPAGEVQVMSAGRGVRHSEHNRSQTEILRLLQIWILPSAKGLEPRYDQKSFSHEQKKNKLCLIASNSGKEGSLQIHQDVNLYASILEEGKFLNFKLAPDRALWLQAISGAVEITSGALDVTTAATEVTSASGSESRTLRAGDGLALSEDRKALTAEAKICTTDVKIQAKAQTEFLLFDLIKRTP